MSRPMGWGVRIRFRQGRFLYDTTSTGKPTRAEAEAAASILRAQKPKWKIEVVPARVTLYYDEQTRRTL